MSIDAKSNGRYNPFVKLQKIHKISKNLEDAQQKNWKYLEEIREDLRKAFEREKMLRSMLDVTVIIFQKL